jgi:hypothetical protein
MRRSLIVAIAVGMVAVATVCSCSSNPGQIANSDPVPDPLVNIAWILTSVQREGQATMDVPEHVFVVRTTGGATLDVSRCNQWVGLMQFHDATVDVSGRVSPHSCPALDTTGGQDPIEPLGVAVMNGSLRWSLDGDHLALNKPGVGVLTFSRGRSDPPSPSS